ncbi:MAG TPA: phosphate acyltransferase [Candidatus Ratteibacteria bacterium]|nr:phosphate acyltransferase [Candidatus Ratteibacteria bacterium]
MGLIENFIEKAKRNKKRVVFPEGEEERLIESAIKLEEDGIARPILVGRRNIIKEKIEALKIPSDKIEIVDIENNPYIDEFANVYSEKRKIKLSIAQRLIKRELIFGGMMLLTDKVDLMIAGAANTTASVIQASSLTVGYKQDTSTPSSFFIMVLPDNKIYFYADCAVNIDPTYEQLADIGISTGENFECLIGEKAKVAFLSFSTKGSASHPLVEKVQKAVEIAKSKNRNFPIDGEFQADTAIVSVVAEKKLKGPSEVAGKANVLIFPDLNSGNISYKLTQYLAKAQALGPILQGFAKPVSDLSRGAKVEDIIKTTAILSCMC